MEDIAINYLALFVAAFASMMLGFLWYLPGVFGKRWMAAAGISSEKMLAGKTRMPIAIIGGFVCQIVTAYVLVHFIALAEAVTISEALELAFWAWMGFFAVTSFHSVVWEGKPTVYWAINAGYQLAAIGLMSLILVLWV